MDKKRDKIMQSIGNIASKADFSAKVDKNLIINFLKSLNIIVNTKTKARGHQGFYFQNRIDVSKNLDDERAIEVLVHEFAHFIHGKIEKDIYKTGGSLEKLFLSSDLDVLERELLAVTFFIDSSSRLATLQKFKTEAAKNIKNQELLIKQDYPDFMRSKPFKPFDKYIRHSNARYLLKADRVSLVSTFLRRKTLISIDNLQKDFYDMPQAFAAYIRLRAYQRRQARISRRINKLKKYYSRPSELFARFVESIFSSLDKTRELAPNATEQFFYLLDRGHYFEMNDFLKLTQIV